MGFYHDTSQLCRKGHVDASRTRFGWLVVFGLNDPLRQYFSLYRVVSQRELVGCFGLNGPLRQYFSLYRAVSQREGERGEKG